jgi:hypothetical protein
MTTFDRSFLEERWSQVLREHTDRVADCPANAHLSAEVGNLRPGFALDAGWGHGPDTLWLAARGWQGHRGRLLRDRPGSRPVDGRGRGSGRCRAHRLGRGRSGDLDPAAGPLRPRGLPVCPRGGFVEEMVRRMAAGVAPGGTLFLLGHRPTDPATGAATAAADQVQVSIDTAVAALDPGRWEVILAEDRRGPWRAPGSTP